MASFLKQLSVLLGLVAIASSQELVCTSPSKFHIPTVVHNWIGAVEYCHLLGMRLAVVDSEAKHNEIVRLVEFSKIYNMTKTDLWIGASDLAQEGNFVWHATGMEPTFSKWNRLQPDNAGGTEHCVHMWYEPTKNWNWHWNDWNCELKLTFVCENAPRWDDSHLVSRP
ncbi:lectin subunit alpha-like [Ochlerotatus camptorhynchus]|uniref:lectin subunit alpha-like n=1 Tax=Ochlerotatus camptorhynchus TaxID=644619 RepID=UPI0031CFD77D